MNSQSNYQYDMEMLSKMVVALSRIKSGRGINDSLDEVGIHRSVFDKVCKVVESNRNLKNLDDLEIEAEEPAPTLVGQEKLFCAIVRCQDLTLMPIDVCETIDNIVSSLSETEQTVLRKRYWEGLSYAKIGEIVGLSGQGVLQLERRVLRNLREPNTLSYIKSGQQFYKDCEATRIRNEIEKERERLAIMQEGVSEYTSIKQRQEELKSQFKELDFDHSVEVFLKDVKELGLPVRLYHCLIRSGITTIRDLSKRNAYDLMHIRNLGKQGLKEIVESYETFTGKQFDNVDFTPKFGIEPERYREKCQKY